MKIAYFSPSQRASGKMLLSALLETGLPVHEIEAQIEKLNLAIPFHIQVIHIEEGLQQGTTIEFLFPEHEKVPLLSLESILTAIQESGLSARVKASAVQIFNTLFLSGAKVYQKEPEEFKKDRTLPFSNIIEIIGFISGLASMGIEQLFCAALPAPEPFPREPQPEWHQANALALSILINSKSLIIPATAHNSGTSPTAAAILSQMALFEQPAFRIEKSGLTFDKKRVEAPLQILVGETGTFHAHNATILIETNLDDMSPQILGDVTVRLLEAGALDVYQTPIYMKKNRAGIRLSVVVRQKDEKQIAEMMLRETSTLGLQTRVVEHQYQAQRIIKEYTTDFGIIPIKLKYMQGEVIQAAPEYEACAAAARQYNVPVLQVYQAALAACHLWGNNIHIQIPQEVS